MPQQGTTETAPTPFIDAARALVSRVEMNASLAALVGESMERLARVGPPPDGYFRVIDLVNPAAAFWARRTPHIEEPVEISRRLASGKVKHKSAGYWLAGLEGFVFGEGRVEGAYVGVNGVVGRIDFLLGERSTLEYKTKSSLPEDPGAVWDAYPMDVEQTAFYGVLLPKSSDDHYLVFDQNGAFRCFRVKLLNRGDVLNVLRQRMDALRRAIETGDPSRLGRCRYVESGCKFAAVGVCGCSGLAPLDATLLRRSIELVRDSQLERAVEAAFRNGGPDGAQVWWWDLVAPRRRFLEEPPSYTQEPWKNACRWLLQEGVRNVPALHVGPEGYRQLSTGAVGIGLRVPMDLLLARRAGQSDAEIVPYIARAARGRMKEHWQLNPYYMAELAVPCAAARSRRGVVIVMYPQDGNKIAAYDVTFRDPGVVRRLVEARTRDIRQAEEKDNPLLLPECPTFMRTGCATDCLCRTGGTSGVSRSGDSDTPGRPLSRAPSFDER